METEAQIYDSLSEEQQLEMAEGIGNELEFSQNIEHVEPKAESLSFQRSRS